MNRRRLHGFTLVEVLVAAALLSLVMLGLVTAMRSFADSEARIDDRIRGDEDLRATEQFLRAIVGAISPRVARSAPGAARQVAFSGAAEELNWIGVMPARQGAGGLYRFRLFARPDPDTGISSLMLEYAALTSPATPFESGPTQSRVMVAGVQDFALRYQGGSQADASWLATWPDPERLPRRIGLLIGTASGPWPEIVIAVVPATGPGTASRAGGDSVPMVGPF